MAWEKKPLLVSRPRNVLGKVLVLPQDRIRIRSPAERSQGLVEVSDQLLGFGVQHLDAREGATPDCSLGHDPKPASHLVKPGGVGRCGVD